MKRLVLNQLEENASVNTPFILLRNF